MKVIVISLAPYDIDDDPNLNAFAVKSTEKDDVFAALNDRYDIDADTFKFYDETAYSDAGGSFTTVEPDDDTIQYDWVFEVLDV